MYLRSLKYFHTKCSSPLYDHLSHHSDNTETVCSNVLQNTKNFHNLLEMPHFAQTLQLCGVWGWGLIRRIELLDSHHWLQLANYKKLPISGYKYYTNTIQILHKYYRNTSKILYKFYKNTMQSYKKLPISGYICRHTQILTLCTFSRNGYN